MSSLRANQLLAWTSLLYTFFNRVDYEVSLASNPESDDASALQAPSRAVSNRLQTVASQSACRHRSTRHSAMVSARWPTPTPVQYHQPPKPRSAPRIIRVIMQYGQTRQPREALSRDVRPPHAKRPVTNYQICGCTGVSKSVKLPHVAKNDCNAQADYLHLWSHGRLAQGESASLTRKRSQVQIL